ncbi:MAG: hypothetical protein QGG64_07705 [Candidatus Latescibacteria bacterium]|jgi:hypothetical protein|nr:hypothetical protein [Candidatus Latescibacterota bacterium]
MMGLLPFAKQVGLALVLMWGIGVYPLYAWGGMEVVWAAVVGCLICTANTLAGGGFALWAMGRDNKTFMLVTFGGMGIRLLIVLIFFFLFLKLVKLHVFSLTLSLFLFYVVFQILEIRLFTRRPSGDDRTNA